jgi:restriction system protein
MYINCERIELGGYMAVPDFQSFFKPLLDIASDGKEHSMREVREKITTEFNLSTEDLSELLPSGT